MKIRRLLTLFVIGFIALACAKAVIHDPTVQYKDLIVIVGQSNANGHENKIRLVDDSVHQYAYLAQPMIVGTCTAFIKNYWFDSSNYNVIRAGINTGQQVDRFGIQPRLAWNLLNYKKRDVYILQSAFNGSPIYRWNDSMAHMEYAYRHWLSFKTQAESENKVARLKAVIFIQGEADAALYQNLKGTYKKELQNLAYRFRLRFDPNLKFIIGQALANSQCAGGATVVNLMEMQRQVALEPGNYLVPYVVGDTLFDSPPCHYNIETYNRKADQIFEIIKDL